MEYEAKLSDIIASLPEVAGGFLFAPDRGLYSNQAFDIADDDSLQQVSLKLTKMVSMLSVHFHDTKAIRVNFKDLILHGTSMQDGHWLFLFHQPSLSPGMLKMTVQMALNIEADPIEPNQTNEDFPSFDPPIETIETPEEDIMETLLDPDSELYTPLSTIQDQLAYYIGPIANLIFKDSIELWAAKNSPSADTLPYLIDILEEEIDNKEDRKTFRNCLNSI